MDEVGHVDAPSKDSDAERRASAGNAGPGPGSRSTSPTTRKSSRSVTPAQAHAPPAHAAPHAPALAPAPAASASHKQTLGSTHSYKHFRYNDEDVVVVHVRAGSEYQAMLYLLRSVSRHFRMDDVLPEPPEHIAAHRYQILRAATDGNPDGDAVSLFQVPQFPEGLLLRRLRAEVAHAKPSAWDIVLAPREASAAASESAGGEDASEGLLPSGEGEGGEEEAALDPYMPGPDDIAAADALEAGASGSVRLSSTGGGGSRGHGSGSGWRGSATGSITHTTLTLPPGARISDEAEALAADVEALLGPEEAAKVRAAAAGLAARRRDSGSGQRRRGGMASVMSVTTNQARAWVRLAGGKMEGAPPQQPFLMPIAMPNQSGYLKMAAEAVVAFNKRGLLLTPYLHATCEAVACAVRIQAAWRAYRQRRSGGVQPQLLHRRAAVVIQRAWRACLMRMRLDLLTKMRVIQAKLSALQLGVLGVSTLALSVRGCEVLRERLTLPLRLFPEHRLRFVFDDKGRVHLLLNGALERSGLPLWAAPEVQMVPEGELEERFGPHQVHDQKGALVLLLQGATWKDAKGAELPREKGLPEPPPGAKSDDVLLQVCFASFQEAAVRAALLLGLTYDPKYGFGAALLPLSATNIARVMPMPSESRVGTPSTELIIHRWTSLNTASLSSAWQERMGLPRTAGSGSRVGGLSPPHSAQHSYVSETPLPEWATPPMSRLASPIKPVSPGRSSRFGSPGNSPTRAGPAAGVGSLPSSPRAGAVRGGSPSTLPVRAGSPSGGRLASQGSAASRGVGTQRQPSMPVPPGLQAGGRAGSPDLMHRPPSQQASGRPPSQPYNPQLQPLQVPGVAQGHVPAFEKPPSRKMLPPLSPSGSRGGRAPAGTAPHLPLSPRQLSQPPPQLQHMGFGQADEMRPGTAAPALSLPGTSTGALEPGFEEVRPSTAAASLPATSSAAPQQAGPAEGEAGSLSRAASGRAHGAAPDSARSRSNSIRAAAHAVGVSADASGPPGVSVDGTISPELSTAYNSPIPWQATGSRPPSREEAAILQQRGQRAHLGPAIAAFTRPIDPSQRGNISDPSFLRAPPPRPDMVDSSFAVGPWQSDDSTLLHPEPWEMPTPSHQAQHPKHQQLQDQGQGQGQGRRTPGGPGSTEASPRSQGSRLLIKTGSSGLGGGKAGVPPPVTTAALLSGKRSASWLQGSHGAGAAQTGGAGDRQHDEQGQEEGEAAEGAEGGAMGALLSDPRFGVLTPNTRLLARVETLVRVDEAREQGMPLHALSGHPPGAHTTYQVDPSHNAGALLGGTSSGSPDLQQYTGGALWAGGYKPPGRSLVSTLVSKAAPAKYSARAMATEPVARGVDVVRAARAEQARADMLTLGGPATIARALAGTATGGTGSPPPQRGSTSPPRRQALGASGRDDSQPRPVGAPVGGRHVIEDAPPLLVREMPVQAVYLPDYVDDLAMQQAALLREEGYAAEEMVAITRDKNIMELRERTRQLTQTDLLWVKHHGTGHAFAPDYTPLTPLAMAKLVAEMRAVYRAAAAETVGALRAEHAAVMGEVTAEKEETRKTVAAVAQRQAGVIKTLTSVYKEEWTKAAQGLVTSRGIKSERKERAAHDRAFAAAFGRQAALLGRNVRRGELSVVQATRHVDAYLSARQKQAEDAARLAAVATAKEELVEMAKWKAAAVRSTGFTQEIRAYQEAADAFNKDVVALRRLEETERRQRVGPAGGVWGSGVPREVLREPLPLRAVGSVADARRRRRRKRRQRQQMLQQLEEGPADGGVGGLPWEGDGNAAATMTEPATTVAACAAVPADAAAATAAPGANSGLPPRTPPKPSADRPASSTRPPTAGSPSGSRPGSRGGPRAGGVLGASGAVPPLLPAIPGASPRPGSRVQSAQYSAGRGSDMGGSGVYSGSYISGSQSYGEGDSYSGSEYTDSGYDSSYSSSNIGQEGVAGTAKPGTAGAKSHTTTRARTAGETVQEEDEVEGSEGSEGEESHVTDYLPEMPYAHGARVPVLSKHRKPTGIVV